jgi:hypothetical protein
VLAASFLQGWLIGQMRLGPQHSERPGELLVNSLTTMPRVARVAEAAQVTPDDH